MAPKLHLPFRFGLILLAGCPQLLDDHFQAESLSADLSGEPDAAAAGAGGGLSGTTRGGAGGAGAAGTHGGGAGGMAGTRGGDGGTEASPVVLSASPVDGARGVWPDADVVFTFSGPMDTASVEAAYHSDRLPAAQVTFVWSEGDTVLRVRPNSPLEVATGSDPASVAAASYVIDLGAQARDKQGRALTPKHVNFNVVRAISQALGAVQDRGLTGNWQSSGVYGAFSCELQDETICAGDGQGTYTGYITFQLDVLPVDLLSISAAALSATVKEVTGAPFTSLGELWVDHVEFIGTNGLVEPSVTALAPRKSLSTSASVGTTMSADVLDEVKADWGTRARSQFRLFFDSPSNEDAVADQVVCDWGSARLTVTYWAP